MTAGRINGLRITGTGKTSFTATWEEATRETGGYDWIVRDLNRHVEVRSGHTGNGVTHVTVNRLAAGTTYNFGVQALPGGPGNNIHLTTHNSAIATLASSVSGRNRANSLAPQGSLTAYQVFARTQLVLNGWSGNREWEEFNYIVMAESGWNNTATNPTGAFGIAQALGHGTALTQGTIPVNGYVRNEYGNFGTSDLTCRAANNGNGFAQIVWMCHYIRAKYGSLDNAYDIHKRTGVY